MPEECSSPPHQASPGTGAHPADLPPGTEVNGFRLVRYVDKGGFGCVWLAESVHCPGQYYAVKFNWHAPGDGSTADARALREVQLLLHAAHPNVVEVVCYGRWQDPQSGTLYMVLQWVEGASLGEWARKANPSLRTLVRLAQTVARALQAAHERGVLHRDVKPGNVLVREADSEPFLADFGVGQTEHSPSLTQGSSPPGTRHYFSPEALAFSQRSGGRPYRFQPADDWYALGVTLYEVLTEVLPFPESPPGARSEQAALQRRPVPPHLLNPRVPLELSQVVMRLLARNPRQRYRNEHALGAALERALAQEGPWEAPVYEPDPPHVLGQTPTQAPTTGDGFVAEDLDVALAHEDKREQGHEERRKVAAKSRRDALLPAQPRVWPSSVRHGVVALALLVAALGVWAAWPQPAQPVVPRETPLAPPVALPGPESVTATPPAPNLAAISATPQKEDTPVKSPQSPPPSQPPSAPSNKRVARDSRLVALCAAGALTAGCPGIPVRPAPKECPPAAIDSMRAHKVGSAFGGRSFAAMVWLDASIEERDDHMFRVGPIVSRSRDEVGSDLPEGTLLFGQVIAGGGERFFIRYEAAQAPDSTQRIPLCAVAADERERHGAYKEPGSTDDVFLHQNGAYIQFVTQFAE